MLRLIIFLWTVLLIFLPVTSALAAVTISTGGATNITDTSATLNGNLNALNSYGTIEVWFEWGLTSGYGNTTPKEVRNTPGPFAATITGLAAGTDYHFRAAALAGSTTVYGSDNVFSTAVTPPLQITTEGASNVTNRSAILYGALPSLGNNTSVEVYFEWGTTTVYGNTTLSQAVTAPSYFSVSIGDLTPGTTYHFRSVAVAGGTRIYGSDKSFRTTGTPSSLITTEPASNITGTSAILCGSLSSMGNYTSVQVWFEWGTTNTYGTSTPYQTLTAPGTFKANITGLSPGTTYYFRAVAATEGTQTYGSGKVFTTISSTPADFLDMRLVWITLIGVAVFMILALIVRLVSRW